jgi:excinuclease ABC subunit C
MLESVLDEISTLGEVRRKALLEHFGSIAALRKATSEEIALIPGIGAKTAETIREALEDSRETGLAVDMSTGEILEK